MRSLIIMCLLGTVCWACSQQTTASSNTTGSATDSIATTSDDTFSPAWDLKFPAADSFRTMLVAVDGENNIFVDSSLVNLAELKAQTLAFQRQGAIIARDKRVFSLFQLSSDRGTNYANYLEVYHTIKGAIDTVRDEEAQWTYQRSYAQLSEAEQKVIKQRIPFLISEAEPNGFGN